MDSPPETRDPQLEQTLRDLTSVCERIAVSLDKLERLYAGQMLVQEKQRQEAEEEKKKWEERQKDWDDQAQARNDQQKEFEAKVRTFDEAAYRFYESIKPAKWQVMAVSVVIAIVLLAIVKAAAVYLFGSWPTG